MLLTVAFVIRNVRLICCVVLHVDSEVTVTLRMSDRVVDAHLVLRTFVERVRSCTNRFPCSGVVLLIAAMDSAVSPQPDLRSTMVQPTRHPPLCSRRWTTLERVLVSTISKPAFPKPMLATRCSGAASRPNTLIAERSAGEIVISSSDRCPSVTRCTAGGVVWIARLI